MSVDLPRSEREFGTIGDIVSDAVAKLNTIRLTAALFPEEVFVADATKLVDALIKLGYRMGRIDEIGHPIGSVMGWDRDPELKEHFLNDYIRLCKEDDRSDQSS